MAMPILALVFGYAAGVLIRDYVDTQRSYRRLREIQAEMDMSAPGSYLQWLSK